MPNIRIYNSVPNQRVTNFQTGRAGELSTIKAGTPIGLLLALTYAIDVSITGMAFGERPNVNIDNSVPNIRITNI